MGGEIGFGERDFAIVVRRGVRREKAAGELFRFGGFGRCAAGLGLGGLRLVEIDGLYDFGRRQRRGRNNGRRGDGDAGDGRRGSLKRGLAFFGNGQRQAVGLGGEVGGVFGLMFTRGGSVGVGQVCPDFALGDGFQAAFVVKRACPRLRLGLGF